MSGLQTSATPTPKYTLYQHLIFFKNNIAVVHFIKLFASSRFNQITKLNRMRVMSLFQIWFQINTSMFRFDQGSLCILLILRQQENVLMKCEATKVW